MTLKKQIIHGIFLLLTILPLSFAFSELSLTTPFNSLAQSDLTGLVLIGDEKDFHKIDSEGVDGLKIYHLDIPGPSEKLKQELKDEFGRAITTGLTEDIHDIILNYFAKYAHPFILVKIPGQDVTDGVLKVIVTEGKVGAIRYKKNQWFTDDLLESYIRMRPNETINMDMLLNDVAWLNQNPYRVTDVVFTPGDKGNTTDIEFITPDRFPVRPFIGFDNTGNNSTGKERLFAGFEWGNAFFADQWFSFSSSYSSDFSGFQAYTGHWTIPLPWRNFLVFFGGWARMSPNITFMHVEGYSGQASVRYQIPIPPLYKKHILEVSIGYDFKTTNNNIEFAAAENQLRIAHRVNISQFMVGLSVGVEHPNNKISFNLLGYWSPGQMYPHMSVDDYRMLTPHAQPKYFYTRMTFSDLYRFPENILGWIQLRGQLATEDLLPGEQYGLGGYDTVRGYEEREISVDDVFIANLELRSPPFGILKFFNPGRVDDELRVLAFFDIAVGGNVHTVTDNTDLSTSEPNIEYLISVGPALRYIYKPYLSLRFDWGLRLHKTWLGNSIAGKNVNFGILLTY